MTVRTRHTLAVLLLLLLSATAQADEYRTYLKEGNRFYSAGDFAAAEEQYILAKNDRPNSAAARFNIGNTYFEREDFNRAIDSYKEALQYIRDERELEVRIKHNLATARVRESEQTIEDLTDPEKLQKGVDLLQEAISGFRDALEIDPTHEDSRQSLTVAQLRIKKLFDDLKRAREEAEKNKDKKGRSPAEVLKELIEEEKAEIALTDQTLQSAAERNRLRAFRKRLDAAAELLTDAARRGELLENLQALEGDAEFDIGAAEVSRALKELTDGEGSGEAAVKEAGERLDAALQKVNSKHEETLEKDREDQKQTRAKTMGLVAGLKNAIEGKTPGAPAAQGQPPQPAPPPQPPPPEVAAVLQTVSGLSTGAAEYMDRALKGLQGEKTGMETSLEKALSVLNRGTGNLLSRWGKKDPNANGESDGEDPLELLLGATRAQKAALEKLQEALKETEKLPKDKQPPQQQQQQGDDGEQQQERKDQEQQEGDQEQKDGDQSKEEQERELSREEAERLLRKFREQEAEDQRDRDSRRRRVVGSSGQLDKDW